MAIPDEPIYKDYDGLDDNQRRNVDAADSAQRERLIEVYRRRNQNRQQDQKSRRHESAQPSQRPRQIGSISSPSKQNPSGRYGAGTGRGEFPSLKRIRAAAKSPTLLDQLRKDGSP